MAFLEDIGVFFEDFSDVVRLGNDSYKGILEQPDEIVADGIVMTTDYQLTAKNSELGGVAYSSTLKVNDVDYSVRSVRKIDDGVLCILSLTKT